MTRLVCTGDRAGPVLRRSSPLDRPWPCARTPGSGRPAPASGWRSRRMRIPRRVRSRSTRRCSPPASRCSRTSARNAMARRGSATGPMPIPDHREDMDLTNPKRADRNPDGVVFYKVSNGRRKPKMPAFKDELTEQQIWSVVAYVQTLQEEIIGPDRARGSRFGARRGFGVPSIENFVTNSRSSSPRRRRRSRRRTCRGRWPRCRGR